MLDVWLMEYPSFYLRTTTVDAENRKYWFLEQTQAGWIFRDQEFHGQNSPCVFVVTPFDWMKEDEILEVLKLNPLLPGVHEWKQEFRSRETEWKKIQRDNQ